MATFRKIHIVFWSDPFIKSLSPEKKYFYLYLLTNDKTKQCGIYEITKDQVAFDTGYNMDTVSILLKYFSDNGKIAYSLKTNEICIKNWNKYNDNKSPKTQILVKQELAKVKDKLLIEYLYSTDTVSIHHQTKSEQEGEEEREKEEEREGEAKKNGLIYNIEDYLEKNQNEWIAVLNSTPLGNGEVKKILKKYHLHQIEQNLYPKKPLQLIAGLKKWILNEKNIPNGTVKQLPATNNKSAGAYELLEKARESAAGRKQNAGN